MNRRNGFTLIELITVMAITAILLTIIFVPVIQGFNLTRAAQGFADAQDRARALIRQVEREIGNAAAVRDNSGPRGAVMVVVPGQTPNSWVATQLPFTKLDIMRPAEGDPTRGPSGAYRNPDRIGSGGQAMEDPTLKAPKGQPTLPALGSQVLTRYFVGLRQPFTTDNNGVPLAPGKYNNPYDGLLTQVNSQRDNLYVLYRANVSVKVWRNGQYVVDTTLFTDANNDGVADDIDDPAFFCLVPGIDADYTANTLTAAGLAKAARMGNWLRQAQVVTEVSRFDMIAPVFEKRSRKVLFNGNVPQLVPLVRFQPTRVTSEPAAGQTAVRSGEEGSNMAKVGPDAYRTKYGAWSSLLMRLWPSQWPANFAANGERAGNVRNRWGSDVNNPTPPYGVARTWQDTNNLDRFSVFFFDPSSMTNDITEGTEQFDVSRYLEIRNTPKPDYVQGNPYDYPYAFTQAVADANGRSGWLANPVCRLYFVPFAPDTRNGKVLSSFESREVGSDRTVPFDFRVPTFGQQTASGQNIELRSGVRVSPFDVAQALDYTPNNDPDVGTGAWSDVIFQPVNRRFNKLWTDFPTLVPGLDRAQYVKRYIDLRICPQPDGTRSALDPSNGVARAYVTPGSEIVVGPDQKPGPNYGRYVRYTRSTQRPVGPNQYFINYVDQPEPDWAAVGLGTLISGNPYDPLNYDPNNLLSAVLQPQYRAGYIELNSRFGEPIPSGYTDVGGFVPTGNIFVSYKFQYTEPSDVVAVDYDSTQVLEIVLNIRNYPQTQYMPNPQSITVKGSAEVRNFVR